MTLSKLTLCALAAASISITLVGCSDEPTAMPASEASTAPTADMSAEPSSDMMTADPMDDASTQSTVTVTGEGPETDGVIINDDLMVEKGYAQANP